MTSPLDVRVLHKLGRLTIPPGLAFLVSCAVVVVAAAGAGVDPWSPASRLAGDAGTGPGTGQ